MRHIHLRLKFVIALFLVVWVLPLSASAFWFWGSASPAPVPASGADLAAPEKQTAEAKYQLWQNGFNRHNIAILIANQDKFAFSVPELNYLFNSEASKVKNPFMSDVNLSANANTINITADFHKVIKGHVSFTAAISNQNNKIRLTLSQTRYYGIPVPGSWFDGLINKNLDDYLAFLYADPRYQNIVFSNNNGILKLRPEFK